MEKPILFISLILDQLGLPVPYGPIGDGLLEKLCQPYMTYTWLVMAFLIIMPKLTMDKMELIPGSGQNFWEVLIGGLKDFLAENLGEKNALMLFPMLATLFLYILVANLIGLIPGFTSPTGSFNITVGMTVIVWVTHHVLGFRAHGLKYYKHFTGPIPIMAPFMIVLELISNFARLLSLSMRLFGNMFAKKVLLGVLITLAGVYFAPLPILCLGALLSVIQAIVFLLLATLYCAQALEPAH
jgi:F-type H+-transporting ATPase subunit a